ncbi:MAG: MBL fold metallo-hydrolase, partial [Chitinophagaceae bacterium]|nr:MBL fold metallo-hydrolase [Chitinophagaceae bacterium]
MKLTYFGHSCFSVEVKGKQLLFDPFISPNELAKGIDVNSIAADYIFVSHGHADHVADLVSIAKRTGALVICAW